MRLTVRDAVGPSVVVEVAELIDGGLQLCRRDGLGRGRFLGAGVACSELNTKHAEDTKQQTHQV